VAGENPILAEPQSSGSKHSESKGNGVPGLLSQGTEKVKRKNKGKAGKARMTQGSLFQWWVKRIGPHKG